MTTISRIPRTLAENEAVIRQHQTSFIHVAQALADIKEEKQYKEAGFDTFDDYCRERWQFNARHGYRLIEAAEVAENVSNWTQNLPAPENESQARAVAEATSEPEEQARVWQAAVEESDGKAPTAAAVKKAAAKVVKPKADKKPKDKPKQTETVQGGPLTELEAGVEWVLKFVVPKTQEHALTADRLLGKAAGLFDSQAVRNACKVIHTEFNRIEKSTRNMAERERRCSSEK